jgi:hypothetical protein
MSALCACGDLASRENRRAVVQKLWMQTVLCGKRWKTRVEIQKQIQTESRALHAKKLPQYTFPPQHWYHRAHLLCASEHCLAQDATMS